VGSHSKRRHQAFSQPVLLAAAFPACGTLARAGAMGEIRHSPSLSLQVTISSACGAMVCLFSIRSTLAVTETVWDELMKVTEAIGYLRGELSRCVGLSAYRRQLEDELEVAEAQRAHFLSRLCDTVPQGVAREERRPERPPGAFA
jgi:hypothetical protein